MAKLVFQISDSEQMDYPLTGEVVRLGRNEENDIVINNSWISSFHAEFRLQGNGDALVVDRNSSNGTFVNGQRITESLLKNGDLIGFGQLEATYHNAPAKPFVPPTAAATKPKSPGANPAAAPGKQINGTQEGAPEPVRPTPPAAATPQPRVRPISAETTPSAASTSQPAQGTMPAQLRTNPAVQSVRQPAKSPSAEMAEPEKSHRLAASASPTLAAAPSASAVDKMAEEMRENLAYEEKRLASIRELTATAEANYQKLRAESESLASALDTVRAELAIAQQNVAGHRESAALAANERDGKISTTQAEIEQTERVLGELRRQNEAESKRHRERVSRHNEELRAIQGQIEQAQSTKAELVKAKAELDEIRRLAATEAQVLGAQRQHTQEEAEELQRQLDFLRDAKDKATKEVEEEHGAALVRLEKTILERESRAQKLEAKIARLQAAEAESLQLEQRQLSLTAELKAREQEQKEFQKQAAARRAGLEQSLTEKDSMVMEREARLAKLDQSLLASEQAITNLEARITGMRAVEGAMERVHARNQAVTEDLKAKEAAQQEVQQKAEKAQASLQVALAKLEKADSDLKLRRAEIATLSLETETHRSAAQASLDYLTKQKEELATTQATLRLQRDILAKVESAILDHEQKHFEAQSRLSSTESEANETTQKLQKQREELEREISLKSAELQQLQKTLEESTCQIADTNKQLTKLKKARTDEESKHAQFATQATEAASSAKSAAAKLQEVEAALSAKSRELADLEAAVQTKSGKVSRENAAESAKLSATKTELDNLVRHLAQTQQEAQRSDAELAKRAAQLAELEDKISAVEKAIPAQEKKLASAQAELNAKLADMRGLGEKHAAALEELARVKAQHAALAAQSIQSTKPQARQRAHGLPEEIETLTSQKQSLESLIQKLEEKKKLIADAIDLNWGTVHAMAKGVIKNLDLLEDMIRHVDKHPNSREVMDQLKVFRAGLLDVLVEYSVQPYSFAEGTVVDVAARKRIHIVETRQAADNKTLILETFRPGYVCTNGQMGVQTLLRKADVCVATPH